MDEERERGRGWNKTWRAGRAGHALTPLHACIQRHEQLLRHSSSISMTPCLATSLNPTAPAPAPAPALALVQRQVRRLSRAGLGE